MLIIKLISENVIIKKYVEKFLLYLRLYSLNCTEILLSEIKMYFTFHNILRNRIFRIIFIDIICLYYKKEIVHPEYTMQKLLYNALYRLSTRLFFPSLNLALKSPR